MIEFNLLPDVKLAFIKTRRIKRLVILISGVLSIAALVIFVFLLFYVDVIQKQHVDNLGSSITHEQSLLGDTANLNKTLTIQNQLATLPTLNDAKPAATRLFQYLVEVTPASASISQISVGFGSSSGATPNTMTLTGNADSLITINQFVDTLKFTTFNDSTSSTVGSNAFSDVVLTSYGLQAANGSSSSQATYTISLNFNPAIFNIQNSNVNLHVPANLITTRSITQQPTDLFQKSANTSGGS